VLRIFLAFIALGLILALGLKIYDYASSSEEKHQTTLSSFTGLSELEKLRESGGSKFETSFLSGKNLVINFFASWCDPCKREIIEIQKIHARDYRTAEASFYLDERSVLFVGINSGETDEVRAQQLISETGASYLILYGDDGTLLEEVGAVGLPFTVFVNSDGVIVGKYLKAMTADDVYNRLEKYFGP